MKKVFERVTDVVKDDSKDITETMTKTSEENDKALAKLNNKLLILTKGRGILAIYLLPPLCKVTNPEHASQNKLVKDANSNWVNDLLRRRNNAI